MLSSIGRKQNHGGSTQELQYARNNCIDKVHKVGDMLLLNKLVEKAWAHRVNKSADVCIDPSFLHNHAWEQWLWHEDPAEESHIDILMNRMQLLGLLIARCVCLS